MLLTRSSSLPKRAVFLVTLVSEFAPREMGRIKAEDAQMQDVMATAWMVSFMIVVRLVVGGLAMRWAGGKLDNFLINAWPKNRKYKFLSVKQTYSFKK